MNKSIKSQHQTHIHHIHYIHFGGDQERLLSADPSLLLHGIYDCLPATFAHHHIRPATASPYTRFKHHLIRRRCFPSWQCLPMRYPKNMSVFAPWISALECEFQRVDAVPVLMITVRTTPIVAAGDLSVKH